MRILFTQGFFPDIYIPEKLQQGLRQLDAEQDAELDTGVKLNNLMKSKFTNDVSTTIKFFAGKLALITSKNQVQTSQHLTWQQSLYEYKRQVEDDLIMVFARALTLFKG